MYNEQAYSDWGQLPPNLLVPNNPMVPCLFLNFHKIIYLNQRSEQQNQINVRVQWWGMQKPHLLTNTSVSSNERIGKYVICCSIERLMTYLFDMKLLGIELTVNNRVIGKAHLNFLLLKGWKCQQFSGYLDIKQNNKKIGQITYSIQIVSINNPFVQLQSQIRPKIEVAQQKQFFNRELQISGIQLKGKQNLLVEQIKKREQNNPQSIIRPQPQIQIERQQSQKDVNLPRLIQNQNIKPNIPRKRNEYLYEQQPVLRLFNEAKYQTQLFRLIQDYNLLFNRPILGNSMDHNTQNMIQIQIVKIEGGKEGALQIEITLPLVDGAKNIYKMGAGGIIKLYINGSIANNDLIAYLKDCNIEFRCGKLWGQIKLTKVLSKKGEMLSVALFERQNKKESSKKKRGSCWIKTLPPQKIQINKQPPKIIEQEKIKLIEVEQKEEYVLVSLKKYHSLERNKRKVNYFVKLKEKEHLELANSKTVWNCQQDPIFDQSITFKVKSKTVVFQLYDRQKNYIKLGQGELKMISPLGINLQLPIVSRYMNGEVVIGYLSLDYVKNGLQSVTKMQTILNVGNKANKQIIAQPIKQNNETYQNNKKQLQNNQQKKKINELKENIFHLINEPNDNNQEQIQHKQIGTLIEQDDKNVFQKDLSLLQIHNKIFTFLHSKPNILQSAIEFKTMKITQFVNLMDPLVSNRIINHKQLYLLISHYLFASQQTKLVNKINLQQFKDSFDSFCTYYEQSIQERDILLKNLLSLMDNIGMTVNDLQYELKSSSKIWQKLNDIFFGKKNNQINIIQKIKQFYKSQIINRYKQNSPHQLNGVQFCDILRRYEVYETTIGEEIQCQKLNQIIYYQICDLLSELQPNIKLYSFHELIQFMKYEEIVLSRWEILSLEDYLQNNSLATFRKNPNKQFYRQQKQTRKEAIPKYTPIEQINKPTISKSPTFGYLHQPQFIKPQLMTSQNQMVDSLAIKLNNLAISPINHNSTVTYNPVRAVFSNLKFQLVNLYVNDYRIHLHLNQNNQHSESQNILSKENYSSSKSYQQKIVKQRQGNNSQYDQSLKNDFERVNKLDNKSHYIYQQKDNLQINLENVERNFNYKVEVCFQEQQHPIYLECMHNEWTGIVSEDGQYLGGVLIY